MITLYCKSTTGKTKIWTGEVIDNGSYSDFITTSGFEGGKRVPHSKPIKSGKNIGKSNETTHYSQAVDQLRSKVALLKKKGFVEQMEEMKEAMTMGLGFKAPMLAAKYDPTGKQKGSKTLAQFKLLNEYIFTQRKFDGHRCPIWLKHSTQECKFYTRGGDESYVFPHIKESLLKSFNEAMVATQMGFEDEIYLDGELYSFTMNFNDLSGLIRKKHRTPEHVALEHHICYNLYDIYSSEKYEDRKSFLTWFLDEPNVYVVESEKMLATDKNLEAKLTQYLEEGFEGLMIRDNKTPYEHKRSKSLIKMKLVQDEEFKIIGFKEGTEGDTLGSIIFQTDEGKVFNATFNGTDEKLKEIWNNQDKYLQMWGTIEFFEYTPDDIPRFPKCIKFRPGRGQD